MTPLIDPLNPAPPAPEATVADPPPEEPTVTYQPPSLEELHQDSPLDPKARPPIVAGLVAMAQRGAAKTYINEEGETVTCKVKTGESLRAMRAVNALGRLSLRQQKADHNAKLHRNSTTLNDHVTPVIPLAHQRMTEEARRRGLSCAAALDKATSEAVCDKAEKDYIAEHGPLPQTGPKPMKPTAPERRNDRLIPKEAQVQIMNRLRDMVDPNGQELPPHEYLQAVQVLVMFCRLVDDQERFDRLVQTGGPTTDWEALRREWEEVVPRLLEQQERDLEAARRSQPQ
jgi:hypothetical protein